MKLILNFNCQPISLINDHEKEISIFFRDYKINKFVCSMNFVITRLRCHIEITRLAVMIKILLDSEIKYLVHSCVPTWKYYLFI